MTQLPQTNGQFVGNMSNAQSQELLQEIATRSSLPLETPADLQHSLIVKTPDVCGGAASMIRTRIPVWVLEQMRKLGVPEAEILQSFPTLKAVDLVQAWSYANQHRDEIDAAIHLNEEA
jgi:uncharacterized protein (DUF433 family)